MSLARSGILPLIEARLLLAAADAVRDCHHGWIRSRVQDLGEPIQHDAIQQYERSDVRVVDAEQHEHDADAQFEGVRQSVGFVIETSDLVFALDSVPAVLSVTGTWVLEVASSCVRHLVITGGNPTTRHAVALRLVFGGRPGYDRNAEQLTIEIEHRQQLTRCFIIDSHLNNDEFGCQLPDALVSAGQRLHKDDVWDACVVEKRVQELRPKGVVAHRHDSERLAAHDLSSGAARRSLLTGLAGKT